MFQKTVRTLSLVIGLIVLFAVASPAQTSGCAALFPKATLTPDIYWAHQPAAVRALRDMPDGAGRIALAGKLAAEGYQIDPAIMAGSPGVGGWDPVCAMGYRQAWGLTWVPAALQPPVAGPGISNPPAGYQAYDPLKPPAGAIIVSVDAKDYPPADPPVVLAAPQPATNVVGQCFGNVCNPGPGANKANLLNGQEVTEGGVQYVFHTNQTPFGVVLWFEKQ